MRIKSNLFFLGLIFLALSFTLCVQAVDDLDDEVLETEKIFNIDPAPAQPVHHETVKQQPVGGEHFDDEEFVGFEHHQPEATPLNPDKPAEAIPETVPEVQEPPKEIKISYYLEAFYIVLTLGYAANYYFGSKRNDQLAKQWGSNLYTELKSNFTKLGEGDKAHTVVREDANNYRCKATGRSNCFGLQAILNLRKREDAMTLLFDILTPTQDTVTIDILMNDELTEPFVFAITPKREEKKFRRNHEDVKKFAEKTTPIAKSFVALTEVDEITNELFTQEMVSVLSQHEKDILSIHISDQGIATDSYKKSVRFVFRLDANQPEKLQNLYKFALRFIDVLASFRLSKNGKQKVVKNRVKQQEEELKLTAAERQEAAQQRKYEKIQKQKQGMTVEAAAALDERLAKKELKKRQAGRMKIMR